VPVIVPCHRIIRGDGTWGHYAFGGEMKTQLLRLERSTPAIIGCTSTRIVCRRGCAHEQPRAGGEPRGLRVGRGRGERGLSALPGCRPSSAA
jgi:hypothetical protein